MMPTSGDGDHARVNRVQYCKRVVWDTVRNRYPWGEEVSDEMHEC
jgi:hypothetical protein